MFAFLLKPEIVLSQLSGDTLSTTIPDTSAYVPPDTSGGSTSGEGTIAGGSCYNSPQWTPIGSTDHIYKCPPEGSVGIGVTSLDGNRKLVVDGGANYTYNTQRDAAHHTMEMDVSASWNEAKGNIFFSAGTAHSWHANVRMFGARSSVVVDHVKNNNGGVTMRAVGGKFTGTINNPLSSSDAGTGSYYIGGLKARITGEATVSPSNWAIAAFIARDEINNEHTYAGYFEGKMHVTGKVGIAVPDPVSLLHVRLPNSAMNFIRFEGLRSVTNGHAVRLELTAPNSPSAADQKHFHIINANQSTGGSNRLIFRAATDDGQNAGDIMTLDHGGNVSLGGDLEVCGTIRSKEWIVVKQVGAISFLMMITRK